VAPERLTAEAESAQIAAFERLNATVLAALREETEELRAELEGKLAESVQAIERAAEKRGRQAAAERAAEASTLLSNAVQRVSELETRRIEEEIDQLDRAAEDWRARLTEVVDRRMKDHATRLAEEAERRKAAMDARFDVVLEDKTKALARRVEDAITHRHRELVARMDERAESSFGDLQAQLAGQAEALEQAARERAEQAEAERDEKAVMALSELEERLTATVAESLRHTTAQAESQLADHVSALEKTDAERSHDAEANRAEELAAALAEMDGRLGAALAGHRTEADRIRERTEAFLVEGQKRLEQLAEDLQAGIAEAAREAGRATEEGARYIGHLRALTEGDVPSGTEPALDSQAVELDANAATVDDLRGLDLSLTQATRLISHRDAVGGFTSVEQVDDVPGISRELRTKLKRCLAISDEGESSPRPAVPPAQPARVVRRRLRPGRGGARAG
jgi:DNA uptake protein ComE-like DNA-binding protein